MLQSQYGRCAKTAVEPHNYRRFRWTIVKIGYGKTEGTHCTVCNEVLVAQKDIPAKGHTEVTDEAVAATCTEDGKTEGTNCSVCNAVLVAQGDIPALGHAWNEGEVIVVPTCTADGVKTYTCTREGCEETSTEVITALGHDINYKNPDANNHEVCCTRCDYSEGAKSHNFASVGNGVKKCAL